MCDAHTLADNPFHNYPKFLQCVLRTRETHQIYTFIVVIVDLLRHLFELTTSYPQKCMLNERVRRLSIPECITLATQRLTKYPLLFEAILKATKGIIRINHH